MNFEQITGQVVSIARDTGLYIAQQLELLKKEDIGLKDDHNFVTYVDLRSEEMLVDSLSGLIPGAGFLAEEKDYGSQHNGMRWIIDPLDGTTNFVHGIPFFSISIALTEGDRTVLGVVHEVNRVETFYAYHDGAAYLNGRPIRVSSAENLKNSLLVTGFPYRRDAILDEYVDLFKAFLQRTQDLRRLGSAATDLAYVAAGRFEGFYEYGLNPWDVAAGAFIVQQAGGRVTDFKGGSDFVFGQSLVSSNALIHEEMLQAVNEVFNSRISP